MAYLSDDLTDKELAKLEKKINKEYSKAHKELTQRAEEYFKSMQKKYDKQYQRLQDGVITQQEFDTWYRNAVGRGQRWEKLRDDMAERLTRTNEIASSYVNDKTPSIFTLNLNYENYEIEKGSGVSFSIYDESTVRRLIKDNPRLLPPSRVNYTKDKKWNADKLNSELTSAILQGKSIDKLADAFQHVTNMNRVSAIRNARTSMTGAQNGGRMESYKNALNMGIDMQKQWIATHDGLTRKSHQDVDGETIDVNETFSNDCMYPGDPGGHPAEVYNCRCTMRAVIKGINDKKNSSLANKTYYDYIDSKRKGLGSSDGSNVKPHKEMKFLGTMKNKTQSKVEKYFSKFEKDNIDSKIETACVITKDNEIYQCFGISDAVWPDADLGEKLRGADVTHIHPIDETQYSFGKEDHLLFKNFELNILRGADKEYTYQLTKNSKEVDEYMPLFAITEKDYLHNDSIIKAEQYGYGYKRYKND